MARRALDFVNAHPVADTSFAAVVARLADAVTRGDTLGMQLSDGQVAERAAESQRRTLRGTIRMALLVRLVKVAKVAAKTHPELAGLFPLPVSGLPNRPFLLAAESLLAAATANQDVLIPLGLGQTFISDLTTALQQFDTVTQTAHTGRSDHVGARADLIRIVREGMDDVDILDTFIQTAFASQPDLLASWASATNVFHEHAAAAPPEPAPAPAPAPTPASEPVAAAAGM